MSPENTASPDSAILRYMNPVALWTSFLLLVGALRDQRSLVDAFDTGLYLQWMNGFWQSGSLASSVTGEANFLGHHFQPLVLLFSPIVSLFGRPVVLYLLSTGAIFIAWWYGRKFFADKLRWYNAVFLLLIAQPAISGRIWYSFSPDILAFPAFFWMAFQLAMSESSLKHSAAISKGAGQPAEATSKSKWLFACQWCLAFLIAGLSKETFWLTNVAVSLAALFIYRKSFRIFFLFSSIVQLLIFLALFLYWMPQHSSMPSYYGIRFYMDVSDGLKPSVSDLLSAFSSNFFSTRTFFTMGWLFCLTCFLPFIRPSTVWIAIGPGLAAILFARNGQIHHPANHYLIPVLPFLFVPIFFAQTRYGELMAKLGRGLSPLWLSLVPVSFVLFMEHGIVDQGIDMMTHPETVHYRDDVQEIKVNFLHTSDAIVVDGILQPLFFAYPDVTVLLGHTGNPKRLDLANRKQDITVVTTVDFSKVDDCSAIKVGSGQLHADYEYFHQLCGLLKNSAVKVASYKMSGLVVYRLSAT